MAKGSLYLGQARGKTGTIVHYVAKGEQRSRIYTREGGRPGDRATLPAREQRVRFGAAASEWGLYRYICSNMYKTGKDTKESDYNYFVRRNWRYLPWLTKSDNANKVCYWMPGTFATGNLGTCNLVSSNSRSGNNIVISTLDIATAGVGTITSSDLMSDYIAWLSSAYPNASKITFAVMYQGLNGEVAGSVNTPNSRLHTYTLDLTAPNIEGVANMTVGEWLATICNNPVWLALAGYMQSNSVVVAQGSMIIAMANSTDYEIPTPPADDETGGGGDVVEPGDETKYAIVYRDADGETIETQYYAVGATIVPPTPPDGYKWPDSLPTIMPADNVRVQAVPIARDGESDNDDILEEDSNNCIISVYPTNDKANDVYTVNLLPVDITNSQGGWLDYSTKRTAEALADAAASYGYQTDTMHANIYYSGTDVEDDIDNAVRILALRDAAAANRMSANRAAIAQERAAAIRARAAAIRAEQLADESLTERADNLIEEAISAISKRSKRAKN